VCACVCARVLYTYNIHSVFVRAYIYLPNKKEMEEDNLLGLSLGAFVLPGHVTPGDMELAVRGWMRANNADSRGMMGSLSPSWLASSGWILALICGMLYGTGALRDKASKRL